MVMQTHLDGQHQWVWIVWHSVRDYWYLARSAQRWKALQVNNAGVLTDQYQQSKQGHEMHFATNHLGHFLLTQLLMQSMASPGTSCAIQA